MASVLREAFNGVFVLRVIAGSIIGGLGGAAIAYAVAFYVADYISKANVNTMNQWLAQLDGRVGQSASGQSELNRQLGAVVLQLEQTNQRLGTLVGIEKQLANLVRSHEDANRRQHIFEGFALRIAIKQATPEDKLKDWPAYWGLPTDKRWDTFLTLNPGELQAMLVQYSDRTPPR